VALGLQAPALAAAAPHDSRPWPHRASWVSKSTEASPGRRIGTSPDVASIFSSYRRLVRAHRAMEDMMSTHPNIAVIDKMTQAIVENDRETLSRIFTDDMVFHGRGPIPFAGDHDGVDGLLAALGTVFELTDGDVKLEQLFCLADDEWGAEWEHAVFGRNGRTLELNDSFVYRFDAGRIREMWFIAAGPAEAASFWA
jgi:ketosteroid isomerase-like protein